MNTAGVSKDSSTIAYQCWISHLIRIRFSLYFCYSSSSRLNERNSQEKRNRVLPGIWRQNRTKRWIQSMPSIFKVKITLKRPLFFLSNWRCRSLSYANFVTRWASTPHFSTSLLCFFFLIERFLTCFESFFLFLRLNQKTNIVRELVSSSP